MADLDRYASQAQCGSSMPPTATQRSAVEYVLLLVMLALLALVVIATYRA
jgi:hypothetical protein